MEIGDQLNSIVESIVEEIKTKVNQNLADTISQEITEVISKYDFESVIADLAKSQIETALKNYLRKMEFPANSIAASAINFENYQISGDYIKSGIISNFASSGIDDKATQCQLTILDNAVVVEQPIITTGIKVQGNVQVNETLTVQQLDIAGHINPESAGYIQFIAAAEQRILSHIAEHGLIAPKLIFNDKNSIDETQLPNSLTVSNLRRVGTLEELQTRGDTLLDETLFVSRKRVGINTLEPTYALSVWDEEVEIAINKTGKNKAFIGSHRPVNVILGAADNENISLEIDGSVTINDLRLGALPLSTASIEPNWEGRAGEIVFNDSPQIGRPIGWVCLQGTRWAKFGIIQE
jgi:citrate lyase gamma subunit